jgi:hypothetical protein
MNDKETKTYSLISRLPVAEFWYKGKSHTHPVQRQILIIREDDMRFVGYELKAGHQVRSLKEVRENCIVKTYRKDRIAKFGDYCRLRMNAKNFMKDPNQSTLERKSLSTLFGYLAG